MKQIPKVKIVFLQNDKTYIDLLREWFKIKLQYNDMYAANDTDSGKE